MTERPTTESYLWTPVTEPSTLREWQRGPPSRNVEWRWSVVDPLTPDILVNGQKNRYNGNPSFLE